MADQPTPSDIALFGLTNYRGARVPFGIKTDDRRRHMYIIGKTGMGKSTMMENMIVQDIRAGRGLAVVDPHGDTVEKIIKFVPSYRVNDVVYFNPADQDYPIAFNILEAVTMTQRHLVASGLIGVFKKIWVDSWGPRLEYILRNTILALLEYEGSTLLGVLRIYVDKEYRKKVLERLTDPIVKSFWTTEFEAYAQQFRSEAVSPIQNKIGQFLSSSIIRNIVGQSKSTIDMRDIMDTGKILLMNLSKGRIGEDNASLLGAMMITKIQLAAMSRIDIPENTRRDFYLYVDEFQNFATDSFASILSEARKYHLSLIVGHQYIEQLSEQVQAAVFGNVGTLVCFRTGAADAEFLAKEFFPTFTETDLVNLTKFDMYLKLMIDGVASEPFSATGLPPVENPDNLQEKIVKVSRERYAKPREEVEEKIVRWSGFMEEGMREESRRQDDRQRGPRHQSPRSEEAPPKDMVRQAPVEVENIPAAISLSEALKQPAARTSDEKRSQPREQRPDRPRSNPPRHTDHRDQRPNRRTDNRAQTSSQRMPNQTPPPKQHHHDQVTRSRDDEADRPTPTAAPAPTMPPPFPATPSATPASTIRVTHPEPLQPGQVITFD